MHSRMSHRRARLGAIRLLSRVFPGRFGKIGAKHFLEPRTLLRPQRWPQAFEGFQRATLEVAGEKVPLWFKGEGPTVLLVHGWESDHYAMGGFVEPLLSSGYRVATLDLPAHGLATGRRAPLPLIAQAIAAAGAACGPLHTIIAHSVGGATSVLGMEDYGLQAERLVLIGAPQAALHQALRQGRSQGLSDPALQSMSRQIHQALGAPLERFRTDKGLSQLRSAVLIVHAEDDAVVPIEAARHNAAACQAKTLWLETGGHNRPLGDPRVIQSVVSFLNTGRRPTRSPASLQGQTDAGPYSARQPDELVEPVMGGASC